MLWKLYIQIRILIATEMPQMPCLGQPVNPDKSPETIFTFKRIE